MKIKYLAIFIALSISVSVASASISPTDPMAAIMINSNSATNTSENSIEVPVGAEVKLAYQENPVSLNTIVKWDVVASEGLEILYTEEFMGGKMTRFFAQEPGIFQVKLTALDNKQIIHNREFDVNVIASAETLDNEIESRSKFKFKINTTDVASEEISVETIEITEVDSIELEEEKEMRPENDSVDLTTLTTLSAENNSSSQQDRNVNTRFVMFILVLIPVLYVMKKKGIV